MWDATSTVNGTRGNVNTSPIKARCTTGNRIDIYIIGHWLVLQIELQNLLTTPNIWAWDNNLANKAQQNQSIYFCTMLNRTFGIRHPSTESGKHLFRWLTCLSNLPGRVSAGSRMSGKFVAAITIIPCKININCKSQMESIAFIRLLDRLTLPHSVQTHPSQQEVDAVFSLCALPTVF